MSPEYLNANHKLDNIPGTALPSNYKGGKPREKAARKSDMPLWIFATLTFDGEA